MNQIWHERPLLIWEGAIAQVQIRDATTGDLLWSQSVSKDDRCVAYAGEPLQAGRSYEWELYKQPDLIAEDIIFRVLDAVERDRISADLSELEAVSKTKNTAAEEIIADRSAYFAKQRLWADALTAAFVAKNEDSLSNAKKLVEMLDYITRWTSLAEFNAESHRLRPKDIHIQLFSGAGDNRSTAQIKEPYEFKYQYDSAAQEWEEPAFRVKLINNSPIPLFFALFDLAVESFAIDSLLETGTVRLAPGQEMWLNDGDPVYGIVPDELWERGVTLCKDVYKVIACTTDFEPTLLNQQELEETLAKPASDLCELVSLRHRMTQMIDRKASHQPREENPEWVANQTTLTFVRPRTISG
ncbi:hypothetical protein IQ254_18370 [Nodosilinea sp. LEGE 07088]|uniref:hypothetical protein n=1 Tax=Nodosilinea sp. LEGE 07088 TaxID=2777968 RepID=UPI001882323D|nr:hypothetical protein [Nodosilinea sp. LEGE 07088]MBE9139136.1 hypothetical protein [Nodosilinea sp. LEGE 07088]